MPTQAQLKTFAVFFALLVLASYMGFSPDAVAAKIQAQ